MPIGTARMASLCLPHATLQVGVDWSQNAALAAAMNDAERPAILLYPGPGARDILAEPPSGPVTLVVVDGTWSQAKTLVRDNPVLHALPRYAFATPEPTQYRIRREPRAEYVSTIEALMHVLGVLEGEPERFRSLLAPLHAMVDAQLAAQARADGTSFRRLKRRRVVRSLRRHLPEVLTTREADLVVVAGEANVWPYRAGDRKPDGAPAGELVHWVARRMSTGEMFDLVAAPAGELSPSTSYHTGLDEAALHGGVARGELAARFAAWLQPNDVVCAWGLYGPRLFLAAGGSLGESFVDLRAAAKRLSKRKIGGLEAYAATLGEAPADARERARRRVGMLAQVLAAWKALP